MSEVFENPVVLILFVLALAIALVLLADIVYGVKIGRASCILISDTVRSAFSRLAGQLTLGFHPVCGLLNW